jgi:phenylacetate-CoA ligase
VSALERLKDRWIRRQYRLYAQRLRQTPPEVFLLRGRKRALAAFHRAARESAAYAEFLRRHDLQPRSVRSYEDFTRRVPLLDKQYFVENDLQRLCCGECLDDVGLFYSSSGSTGVFSYGVETRSDMSKIALGLEFELQNAFAALDRRTLLINCLPMGVKIHTRTIPLAETSVRPDVVWSLVRKLRGTFEQFVIAGEHPFLKMLFERGAEEEGIDWRELTVHVVTGGEYIAESFRGYLAELLGFAPGRTEQGSLAVSYGISELAVSLFRETPETIQLRRLAGEDPAFRETLYGQDTKICPNLMQYYPELHFVETVPAENGRTEMVVTQASPDAKLPLIRYNTRDVVELLDYGQLAERLNSCGREDLLPDFRLPLAVTWGKYRGLQAGPDSRAEVYPEYVKEALYADHDVAREVTGNFRLREAADTPELLVQLRPARHAEPALEESLRRELLAVLGTAIELKMVEYERFPYGFEHDFERKNAYV